jgi:hypothetical protein
VVGVSVHGVGYDRYVEAHTTREDTETLERELWTEDGPAELAAYALNVVATMLESGQQLPDHYLLSHSDVRKIMQVATARGHVG